jgi:hypothetical protein
VAVGLVTGVIVAIVARGSAGRLRSRPFMLVAFGYAVVALVTFTFPADGDAAGGRRMGPFAGTVLSFAFVLALVVYIRRLRRRRERAVSRHAGRRPWLMRRPWGSGPVPGSRARGRRTARYRRW